MGSYEASVDKRSKMSQWGYRPWSGCVNVFSVLIRHPVQFYRRRKVILAVLAFCWSEFQACTHSCRFGENSFRSRGARSGRGAPERPLPGPVCWAHTAQDSGCNRQKQPRFKQAEIEEKADFHLVPPQRVRLPELSARRFHQVCSESFLLHQRCGGVPGRKEHQALA